MKQPALLTRVAGSPPGALVICAAGAGILWLWQLGHLSGWYALVTGAVLWQSLMATRKLYRYKQWRKQWDAMGQGNRPEKEEKKKPERSPAYQLVRAVIFCAALMVLGAVLRNWHPGIFEGEEDVAPLVIFFALVGLVVAVVWYVVTLIRRRGPHGSGAVKESGPVPITQMLNVPRQSPSRHFAEKNLPQYAAALLSSHTEAEHRAGGIEQAESFYAPAKESYNERPQGQVPIQQGAWLHRIFPLALPSWGWPVGAALIIAAVIGGLAHFRQGAAKEQAEEIADRLLTEQGKAGPGVGYPSVRETPRTAEPPAGKTASPQKTETPSEFFEKYFAGPAGNSTPKKTASSAPAKATPAREVVTEEQIKKILAESEESDSDTVRRGKILAFLQALETEEKYRAIWGELVKSYKDDISNQSPGKYKKERDVLFKQAWDIYQRDQTNTP
jgi:hypothetical protein